MSAKKRIVESEIALDAVVYDGAEIIRSSVLGGASIGNDATVLRSRLGRYVRINRKNFVNELDEETLCELEKRRPKGGGRQ